jgi:hypothetical protein
MNMVKRDKSPDLNVLDFYVWGPLKRVVYDMALNDVVEQSAGDGREVTRVELLSELDIL